MDEVFAMLDSYFLSKVVQLRTSVIEVTAWSLAIVSTGKGWPSAVTRY